MSGKIKNFFALILSADIAKQARQVEIITIIVFIFLLLTGWWLWQFKIDITVPVGEKRVVVDRMNIFEILLSKK